MKKHYQIRAFLRQAPNKLLKKYFDFHSINIKFDFEKAKETKIEDLFKEIIELDAAIQDRINIDFTKVFNMSFDSAISIIIQEAEIRKTELVSVFEKMKGACEKAFWTYLNYPEIFNQAEVFASLNKLNQGMFRKIHNMPNLIKSEYKEKISELEQQICGYFRNKEGRGNSCKIDYYSRNNLRYFFCYPEDYSRNDLCWDNQNLALKATKPAFEVIFIYDEQKESLSLYFQGKKEVAEELQLIFAKLFLGFDELPEKSNKVYDLKLLKKKDFSFNITENSPIRKLEIKSLKLLINDVRIMVETGDSGIKAKSINDALEMIFSKQWFRVENALIISAVIKAELEANNKKGFKTKTFSLGYPNSCSLKFDDEDLILRKMLVDSGIEVENAKPVETKSAA